MIPYAAFLCLRDLAEEIQKGRLLAWCLKNTDPDSTIRDAWLSCNNDQVMWRLMVAAKMTRNGWRIDVPLCSLDCMIEVCPRCADAIRREVPEMTIEMLTKYRSTSTQEPR